MLPTAATSLALALGVSALISVACRRIRVPALMVHLAAGVLLGMSGLGVIDARSLGPALKGFITVAIGLLIFEGALHLNKRELGQSPGAVWGLLTVGALVTGAGASAAAHLILGMPWPIAMLLGATLIVTGPTVVQPSLRLVRVAPRLHTVLAAEAILIDPLGVAVTVTTLEVIRLYLLTGPQAGLAGEGAWHLAKPLLGGAGVGLVMGMAGYGLLRLLARAGRPEPQMLNLTAVGVCMTCVGLGEAVTPEAGLAAVTICGVIMARAQVLGATELRAFKELLAIILVGTLFVLLSSMFDVRRLGALTWREGAFVLALLFVVRPACVLLSTWRSSLTGRQRAFAATFAPRGIVALSVAVVAAQEIRMLLRDLAAESPSEQLTLLAEHAERLDLVAFVTICGTVFFASTYSPFWAWLLGVKAGAGTSVLLVGAHEMSIAFAKRLAAHGLEVRIVDRNRVRVANAAAAGVDAITGDATDTRWMDDIGSPHGTGAVVVWTGNDDVDQIVGRWAREKLGPGHTAIWSSKPMRDALAEADIGHGEPVLSWMERFDGRGLEVADSPDPRDFIRVLGWLQKGRFSLYLEGSKPPESNGVTYIGLREVPYFQA